MNIEEIRDLRKMSRQQLKAKAEAMGVRIDPSWGEPKLISVIRKTNAGTIVEQPQNDAAEAQEAVEPVSVADDAMEEQTSPLSPAEMQAALNAETRAMNLASEKEAVERMARMAALTEQSRAMRTGEPVFSSNRDEVVSTKLVPGARMTEEFNRTGRIPDGWSFDEEGDAWFGKTGAASWEFQKPVPFDPATLSDVKPNFSKFTHGLLSDADLHEMLDAWARTFVNDYERIEEDRSSDTLSVRIISRHGMTKCAASGVVFTTSGVKEALAHLRMQAEGRHKEDI